MRLLRRLKEIEQNRTWELTKLPKGHKPITSKWVYNIKYKADGTIMRFKARLVVRGYNQKEGQNHKNTFSLIARLETVRVITALATAKDRPLHQLDVNNALLHGYLDEEIYKFPREGNCEEDIKATKLTLDAKFTIKDLGLAKYFLGIEICRTKSGTHLNLIKYILELLQDAGLTACKPAPSPMPTHLKLSVDTGIPLADVEYHREQKELHFFLELKQMPQVLESFKRYTMSSSYQAHVIISNAKLHHLMGILGIKFAISSVYSKLLSMDVVIKEGLDSNIKLKDMIRGDKWRWPIALQNISVLNSIPVLKLSDEVKDKFLWNTKEGKTVSYSTNKAWKDWRMQDRLTTQERLLKWYPVKQVACLCLWEEDIVNLMSVKKHNRSIRSLVVRFILASCVYFIWTERNKRHFTNEKQSCKDLIDCEKN
ncbi:ribonuclease H-like domain-containing protein [Tanacetum coccineum]